MLITNPSSLKKYHADVCKDCGYNAMSNQIQMVGKLTVLCISMPIVLALLETIGDCFKIGEV